MADLFETRLIERAVTSFIINQPVAEPSADFTHDLMNRAQAELELNLTKEAALIQLLGSHGLVEKPSANFSYRVMPQVRVSPSKPLKPIIPLRVTKDEK